MVPATSTWSKIDVLSAVVREGLEPLSQEIGQELHVEGGVIRG